MIDVFHRDGAAAAVEDDENCKTDGGFRGSDGQNEHREHLADHVVQERREGDHVDVDASRMSSIDIRMMMTFFRLRKMPKTPSVNRMALSQIVGKYRFP
jgi:hypothetical protein